MEVRVVNDYLVQRVRQQAEYVLDKDYQVASAMLTAYADLLEQIERARDGWREKFVELLEDYAGARADTAVWNVMQRVQRESVIRLPRPRLAKLMEHVDTLAVAHLLPSERRGVDQVGELLAVIHGDGGHYQAEHGVQKAAKDALPKIIEMMTKIATHPPAQAAQGDDTHSFKNFHRALCERFGYTHDEKDWRRDQVSLIEFIAAQTRAVPDGFVLVPREPTIEMIMAGRKRIFADMYGPHMGPSAEGAYKAMIAAVPPSTPNTTGASGEKGNG